MPAWDDAQASRVTLPGLLLLVQTSSDATDVELRADCSIRREAGISTYAPAHRLKGAARPHFIRFLAALPRIVHCGADVTSELRTGRRSA